MPRIIREADVAWEGNLARGDGRISAATSRAFTELGFSMPTRVGAAEGKTSPEELLAAAHASCYAMSLASELTQAGTPPERLDVHCTIIMDEVEGAGHVIVASEIDARASVPGIDHEALLRAAGKADAGCPLSRLIGATATVTISASLA